MVMLRGVLAALLAHVAVEALRRWGVVVGPGAEVEGALTEWLGHTVDLACILVAEALRARRSRRSERES